MAFVGVVYIIGILVALFVGRARVGISQFGRLGLDTVFGSFPWFVASMVTLVFWPVVFCLWLYRGRPASPWESFTTSTGGLRVRRRQPVPGAPAPQKFFGPKHLPTTTYGYTPPAGATEHGWMCSNPECGQNSQGSTPRWPIVCPDCGAVADPIFDAPWEHEAEGARLRWQLQHGPAADREVVSAQWEMWQFKEAMEKVDRDGAAACRARLRGAGPAAASAWWFGQVCYVFIATATRVGDLDGAAGDLLYMASLISTDDVENNNTNRTHCRQVIDLGAEFLAAPGATSHPRAAEVRQTCLRIAEASYSVLNRDLQVAVSNMARA